ncbi:hypothetical protein AMAG_19628 [Allomyces macrogynus ATCC 38327]|uniref:Uncharacterized protein n=1 Tax=Allomyces macrogynus (strain ATCC 38327) TaxID=578462 RepID=A0A0L0SY32_ALLM3|nr:hypothetical protein AMAG_19628 [Allomyces macrogynus ATCC 38327]|eukprot:KNE67411.1 hypothetical protein AMAG_19628 [Allomyces macrogynus ATCC 38327]
MTRTSRGRRCTSPCHRRACTFLPRHPPRPAASFSCVSSRRMMARIRCDTCAISMARKSTSGRSRASRGSGPTRTLRSRRAITRCTCMRRAPRACIRRTCRLSRGSRGTTMSCAIWRAWTSGWSQGVMISRCVCGKCCRDPVCAFVVDGRDNCIAF